MFTLLSPQTVRHLHGATEVIVTTFFNNFIASGSSGMLIPSLPIYIILRDRSRDMLSRHVVERLV
jgi:cellobiose-specific phosphotransferase system component IIC